MFHFVRPQFPTNRALSTLLVFKNRLPDPPITCRIGNFLSYNYYNILIVLSCRTSPSRFFEAAFLLARFHRKRNTRARFWDGFLDPKDLFALAPSGILVQYRFAAAIEKLQSRFDPKELTEPAINGLQLGKPKKKAPREGFLPGSRGPSTQTGVARAQFVPTAPANIANPRLSGLSFGPGYRMNFT